MISLKILSITIITSSALLLSSCGQNKLKILNWGEYIDESLLDDFEKECDCKIIYETASSNEVMYSTLISGRSNYDIVFPSEYMIQKLKNKKMIKEIDKSKLTNYNTDNIYPLVNTKLEELEIDNYTVPYYFGSLGIMYHGDEVYDYLVEKEWNALFDSNSSYKVGMYDSSRDSIASALLSLEKSVNTTSTYELENAEDLLKSNNYEVIGDDNLKSLVKSGNLDMALVYSGDYFDTLWSEEQPDNVVYGFYVPKENNLWIDGMVIPYNSMNEDLAYDFIDFILDTNNNFINTSYIGYASPYKSTLDIMTSEENIDDYSILTDNPTYIDIFSDPEYQFQTYEDLGQSHFELLDEIFNNVKASM